MDKELAIAKVILEKRIREGRKELRWSHEKLAEEVDITTRQIRRIEKGKQFPLVSLLYRLRMALNWDQDPHKEFYSEGLYAMWIAYKKYEPDKGPLATYFNYMIRNRLIDMVRKESRTSHNDDMYIQKEKIELDNGNHFGTTKLPVVDPTDIEIEDELFWRVVKSLLTEKQ